MKVEFPKWMYHATKPAVIVRTPEEMKALGRGWQESPVSPVEKKPAAAEE